MLVVSAANPAWDPTYAGSGMFVPVVFSFWLLAVLFGTCLGELVASFQ